MKTNEEYRLLEEQLAKREQQLADVQLTAILGQEEIARLKQQLANATKQIVELREALKRNLNAPRDPDAVDDGFAALDSTQDLAGLVVCDAKPVMKVIRNEAGQVVAQNGDGGYFRSIDYVGKSFYLAKEES